MFTCTPEGRPKGEAYVEFGSEEAQKEALKRHKNEMGERYIELFLSTKANMLQARAGLLLKCRCWIKGKSLAALRIRCSCRRLGAAGQGHLAKCMEAL